MFPRVALGRRDERRTLIRQADAAGLGTFADAFDDGILRFYLPREVHTYSEMPRLEPGRLVGLAVIRAGKITYAELDGKVYAFGKLDDYESTVRSIREQFAARVTS